MTRYIGRIQKMYDLVHKFHDADLLEKEDYESAVREYLKLLMHVNFYISLVNKLNSRVLSVEISLLLPNVWHEPDR